MCTIDNTTVQQYIDKMITHWRKVKDNPKAKHNEIAVYYIDAFQSARISLLGELLD